MTCICIFEILVFAYAFEILQGFVMNFCNSGDVNEIVALLLFSLCVLFALSRLLSRGVGLDAEGLGGNRKKRH